MKKLMAILLCCMFMVLPMHHVMASSEEAEVGGLYSDKTYGGFELSWTNNVVGFGGRKGVIQQGVAGFDWLQSISDIY